MGRAKRIWIPHRFYHVVCRGNRRDPLFKDVANFLTFYYILKKVHEKYPFEIVSFCLMTNHYHLQIRSKEQSLSKVMSLINKRYADYYNTRYKLTGHVFEKRYYDRLIDSGIGMLEVSKYIHLNPVEAHMVKHPEDYQWNSYRYYRYVGESNLPFLNISILLNYYSGTGMEKREKYCKMCLT